MGLREMMLAFETEIGYRRIPSRPLTLNRGFDQTYYRSGKRTSGSAIHTLAHRVSELPEELRSDSLFGRRLLDLQGMLIASS